MEPFRKYAWQPEEFSLVLDNSRSIRHFVDGRRISNQLTETALWLNVSKLPAVAIVDGKVIRGLRDLARLDFSAFKYAAGLELHDDLLPRGITELIGSDDEINAFIDEIEFVGFGASAGSEAKIGLFVESTDEMGAKKSASLSPSLAKLIRGFQAVPDWNEQLPGEGSEGSAVGIDLMKEVTIFSKNRIAVLSVELSSFGDKLKQVAQVARRAEKERRARSNLRQIGFAFSMYESANKRFPQSRNTDANKSGTPSPPYSWRVALLPYLEQINLYNQHRFEEPWDSSDNLKVLEQMPACYRHPTSPQVSTVTGYVVATGEEAIFESSQKPHIGALTDGTSNTLLVAEAKT